MKYSNIGMALCFLLALITSVARGQDTVKITISAVVRGQYGEPVKGAKIINEGSSSETRSNDIGFFTLKAPLNTFLTVNAQGYAPAKLPVSDTLKQIVLIKETDFVPVAFRKAPASELLGGVSTVNYRPIFDKNFTTSGFEGIEALASGFHGNIWGMNSYLVLIDGVPREIDNIMPSEIDQITFLKSAAAVALYGSRGAKGVVLITTKRGEGNGQQIKVRGNAGINVPKGYPKYLGSAEYMTLYNEARANDGLGTLYTQEDIYNYASGANPYRYPNVDYYSSEYLKRSFNRYDITTEISGGNERARYYTNIGFWSAGSLLNFGAAKTNNTNDRINVRGNVDMQLTKFLKAHVDASAVFYSGRGVNTDYWASAATLRPLRFTPLIPLSYIEGTDAPSNIIANGSSNIIDGKYLLGGTQLDQTNPFAAIYAGGSNKFISRQLQFTTGVDADLAGLLKGLSFSTSLGVDYQNSYNQGYNNGYTVYQPNWTSYNGKDVIGSLTPYGTDTRTGIQNISDSRYRQTISFSGQFNYNTSIANKHNISALLVGAAYRQAQSAQYQNVTNSNTGLQVGYNYKQKYYADFTGAMVYSPKFMDDKAYGFSPTASLGWRISEESFLKNSKFVNSLKLTASAGIIYTDLDVADYFYYQNIYTQRDGSYYSWNDGTLSQTTDSRRGANPALTFAKRREISLGIDGAFFNNTLSVSANVFRNQIVDNAIQSTFLFPNYFSVFNSSFIPYVNFDADQRTGFDLNINVRKRSGQVEWIFGTTATYYTTKATKRAEFFANSYQNRQGKPLDAIWGLQNEGFYRTAAEATAANSGTGAPQPAFGQVKAGDIKYKDVNGDGIINNQDEVYLGRGGWNGAPLTLGFNLTTRWKNFTFFALATGRFGAKAMKNSSYFWVDGQDKYSEVVRNRWTEATKDVATFPRLTTLTSDNNFRNSDFWLYSTNRFDLSKVQLSYDLPEGVIKGNILKSLGMYVSGFNLLTIAKERKLMEMNIGTAPQTRFYNVGVKAGF
ncbi:SusC/RagA family TonB-linked outer membrane protein [Mucilaginibacter terrae]|uniref:TonB-linked SusC/RagA family outer membrane protein n=1 Tax=Mucilaginibacter terrae TaxID=1955052 RepID=A0ABU3H012_9SPHI|nr:SusC/RagA family TonB-linked outer membrane protein [Mucilaginibacter terrae]MDT3405362.1 TonB-linked SusC/RagA family outer membrane protein [Mucilaginibacter terrae]